MGSALRRGKLEGNVSSPRDSGMYRARVLDHDAEGRGRSADGEGELGVGVETHLFTKAGTEKKGTEQDQTTAVVPPTMDVPYLRKIRSILVSKPTIRKRQIGPPPGW